MRTILAVTGAALLPIALPAPAAASDCDAQVCVLHGMPDLVVDVYANGDVLLEDFDPGTGTDPLTLPAGDHELQVFAAGADPETETAAIEATATVPAGGNVTVAAHLGEDGTPILTPFVNDVSGITAGEARLSAPHTAAAPAVDVRAGGEPVSEGAAYPNGASVDLAAGDVSAEVTLAGTDTAVIGPADVSLAEGVNTIFYAWGSAEDESLALAVQTISGVESDPAGVPSRTGGLVSDALPWQPAVVGLAGAGALVVLGGRSVRAGARD